MKEDEELSLETLDRVGTLEVQSAGAVAAISRSEIEAQIDVAHKYPRAVKKFIDEAVTLATLNRDIAEKCIYTLPRGGKPISGPSVRMAEICASSYRNLHIGARVVGAEERTIVAQGVVWDLERNVRFTVEKQRRITNKRGERFDDDMITVTGNAAVSIALRDAIFRVIPKAYVNMIYEHVKKVAVGEASTLAARRSEVFDKLQKMGAFQDRILAKIGKANINDVDLSDVEMLIGWGTAIHSGDAKIDEIFPDSKAASADPATKGTLRAEDLKQGDAANRGHDATNMAGATGPAAPAADQKPPEEKAPEDPQQKPPADGNEKCTDDQFASIDKAMEKHKVPEAKVREYLKSKLDWKMFGTLPQRLLPQVLAFIEAGGKEPK